MFSGTSVLNDQDPCAVNVEVAMRLPARSVMALAPFFSVTVYVEEARRLLGLTSNKTPALCSHRDWLGVTATHCVGVTDGARQNDAAADTKSMGSLKATVTLVVGGAIALEDGLYETTSGPVASAAAFVPTEISGEANPVWRLTARTQ